MKKSLFLLTMVLLLSFCLPGLAAGNRAELDQSVKRIFEGQTLQTQLKLEGEPASGEVAYTSSNPKVATVDEAGVVTGVSKGYATITATITAGQRTYRARLDLTIQKPVTDLEINTDRLPLYSGEAPEKQANVISVRPSAPKTDIPVLLVPVNRSFEIRVSALPKEASNRRIVMTSDDPQVLRVNGNGINGRQAGETTLTIASESNPEVYRQFHVMVVKPVSRIAVTLSGNTVAAGSQVQARAEVTPEDAFLTDVVWSSADEKIATVDENGVVTGVSRGYARIVATAKDGSGVRANVNLRVTQSAERITLDKTDVTVDAGRNTMLYATVEPRNTDDKGVIWTSSDESVATVNRQGRITGVALGECEIICTSVTSDLVMASAKVHVQQPVTKVTFMTAPAVYAGETAKLSWLIEPANASNKALELTSSNKRVLTVDNEGNITGVGAGEAYVNAVTTDGSYRRAQVKVRVYQHVTGVHMKRMIAYVDVGEADTTGAVVEPEKASNKNMTWEIEDPNIATITPVKNQPHRITIRGVREGETVIHGVTEDGGFPATLEVKVGDWDHALSLREAHVEGATVHLTVRNNSDLVITSITAEVSVFDINGDPVEANSKDGSNTFKVVYRRTLNPGESTRDRDWKLVDFKLPASPITSEYRVQVVKYQINNDWIKTIRKKNRPQKKCPVHI